MVTHESKFVRFRKLYNEETETERLCSTILLTQQDINVIIRPIPPIKIEASLDEAQIDETNVAEEIPKLQCYWSAIADAFLRNFATANDLSASLARTIKTRDG